MAVLSVSRQLQIHWLIPKHEILTKVTVAGLSPYTFFALHIYYLPKCPYDNATQLDTTDILPPYNCHVDFGFKNESSNETHPLSFLNTDVKCLYVLRRCDKMQYILQLSFLYNIVIKERRIENSQRPQK